MVDIRSSVAGRCLVYSNVLSQSALQLSMLYSFLPFLPSCTKFVISLETVVEIKPWKASSSLESREDTKALLVQTGYQMFGHRFSHVFTSDSCNSLLSFCLENVWSQVSYITYNDNFYSTLLSHLSLVLSQSVLCFTGSQGFLSRQSNLL